MNSNKPDILKEVATIVFSNLSNKTQLNYSLLGGDLGDIMFLYAYSTIDNHYKAIAEELTERMLSCFTKQDAFQFTYCNGIAGMAIGLNELQKAGFISGLDQSLDEIDEILESVSLRYMQTNNLDFLHGLIGIGFYFIMRYKANKEWSERQISRLITFLGQTAIVSSDLCVWEYKKTNVSMSHDLSLSHGESSLLIFLCMVYSLLGNRVEQLELLLKLIKGTCRYLVHNQINPNIYGSWFPIWPKSCCAPYKSRLAWCYGDLGIACALHYASIITGDNNLRDFALRVLLYDAKFRRDLKANHINDNCICHGVSGIYLIFKELSKQTNNPVFIDASMYWENVLISSVANSPSKSRYYSYDPEKNCYIYRSGLLNGPSGIGMALLHDNDMLSNILLISNTVL